MTEIICATRRIVLYPIRLGHKTYTIHIRLWKSMFWDAWYPLPMHVKLSWIAFVGQTIAILTLIELLALKK
jgi:hypothetical protein